MIMSHWINCYTHEHISPIFDNIKYWFKVTKKLILYASVFHLLHHLLYEFIEVVNIAQA